MAGKIERSVGSGLLGVDAGQDHRRDREDRAALRDGGDHAVPATMDGPDDPLGSAAVAAGLAGVAPEETRKLKILYIKNAITEFKAAREAMKAFGWAASSREPT